MANQEEEMGTISKKIVILHGWSYSTEKWEELLSLIKKSGLDYELLKIPGLTAPLSEVWTLDDYVSWLASKVEKTNSKVYLLGHSNGGRIAAAFSSMYPEKVAHLTLIDSAGIVRKDFLSVLKKTVLSGVSKAGGNLRNISGVRKIFYKILGESDYNEAGPLLKKTMVNLISRDLTPEFKKINVPTLIIWGENDKVTPLSDGILIHKLISHSRLALVNRARHSPQFTHPEQVMTLLKKEYENI